MHELHTYKPQTRQWPIERHVEIMQHAEQWPNRPYLPLVHRSRSMMEKYGLGILREGYGPRVYYLNFVSLTIVSPDYAKTMLDVAPFVEYASFEALARDWFVDD